MRVVSVFGPFSAMALVEMTSEQAAEFVPDGQLAAAGPARTINAALRDIERLRARDPELAESALAMSMLAMAYEIDDPYNGATAKSNCQARLQDAGDRLLQLAPPQEEGDALDDLASRRAARRSAGGAAS